jgi:thiamine-phosphate pyrophosphorylase
LLCLITDRKLIPGGRDLAEHVQDALSGAPRGHGTMVQLREKDLGGRELFHHAKRLREVCLAHSASLIINDRIDVALACEADGVHLPEAGFPVERARALMPGKLVGVSIHDPADPRRRQADYALIAPVFETPGKGLPLGLDAVQGAIALGGVDASNAGACLRAGAIGVAVIRAIMASSDPRTAWSVLWSAVHGA